MTKTSNEEICSKCDKRIRNIKKAIYGAVTFQTYYEPAEYGYICENCIKIEERYEKEQQEEYELEQSCDNRVKGESNVRSKIASSDKNVTGLNTRRC